MSNSWPLLQSLQHRVCGLAPLQIRNNVGNRPMTWCELKFRIQRRQNIFGRSPETAQRYQTWIDDLGRKRMSVQEAVRLTVWNTADQPRTVLRPNDFPYWVQLPIQHHVLWLPESTGSLSGTAKLHADEIERFLRHHPVMKGRDRLWFVNPVAAQTVRGICHAQVFSRPVSGSRCPLGNCCCHLDLH
jgi:hypothetical protein